MRPFLHLLVSLIAAGQLLAEPRVTSITPNSGPASGGTSVTIRGTGFETCDICSPAIPPYVEFGGVPAATTALLNSTTIVATTPAMLPMTVPVTVSQSNGFTLVENGFTFTGESGYEPVLMPIFSPPVRGAFGSEFVTKVVAANRADQGVISFLGLDTSCFLLTPVLGPFNERLIPAGIGSTIGISPDCNYDWPARLLHVRKTNLQQLSMNIRVHDTSRNASSHGTEIPVVRRNEFANAKTIVLPGVPTDPRFRITLRAYAFAAGTLTVRANGVDVPLHLQAGRDIFEPAYAQMTISSQPDLQPLPATFSVSILPPPPLVGPSPVIEVDYPFWAFITVTNNDTQEITTITPDIQ